MALTIVELRKRTRKKLNTIARRRGIDPAEYPRKADLIEAMADMEEDPSPLDKIRHPKKRAFLVSFAERGNVTRSVQDARISRALHYHWLDTDPDYLKAFAEAREMAADNLEDEAWRRGHDGVKEVVLYQGELVMVEGETLYRITYSNDLLKTLLRANRPWKYAEHYQLGIVDVEESVRKWAIQHGFDPDVAVEKARQLAPSLS